MAPVNQIGWLVIGGILLWAFVLRPKAVAGGGGTQWPKEETAPPGEVPTPEFRGLQVAVIPGRRASPAKVVYVGDTVGISGGTVQYKGPAGSWKSRVYLQDGSGNDVAVYLSEFSTPLALNWVSVDVPNTSGPLPSTAPLGDLYGVTQVIEAVPPYAVMAETAPTLVYNHRSPSSQYGGLSVSWI